MISLTVFEEVFRFVVSLLGEARPFGFQRPRFNFGLKTNERRQ